MDAFEQLFTITIEAACYRLVGDGVGILNIHFVRIVVVLRETCMICMINAE